MQSQNLGLFILVTSSNKIHLVENKFQMGLHSSAIFAVVVKAVFGFASSVKPIWWHSDLRSREENILQLYNLTIKSVMFGRG